MTLKAVGFPGWNLDQDKRRDCDCESQDSEEEVY